MNIDTLVKLQGIYQVRGCAEDHGIHKSTLSAASFLSASCASVSRPISIVYFVNYEIPLPDSLVNIVQLFFCSFLRDFVYDNVANNRYTIFGKSDSCEI